MGDLYYLADHLRASSTGRATSRGQGMSLGQRSENQPTTSSYLRAVKVLSSSSKRSKKRQSPAAILPKVERLTPRTSAYAEAQAFKLARSSVSMKSENSRNFPTSQAISVGIFPLAQHIEKSDKSAMPTVDEIRHTLRQALDKKGEKAVTVASQLGLERNYLRDFLTGKKRSLKIEVASALAERYEIPMERLTPSREPSSTRIRKGMRPHLYINEHMEDRGFDDQSMANRIDGISPEVFERWRTNQRDLQEWQIYAVLHAFGMETVDQLMRPPELRLKPHRAPHKQRSRA